MGVLELSNVVSRDLIVVQSKSKNKGEILEELTKLLYQNGDISDIDDFLEDVYLREDEGVTAIGQGIAIPHGKSSSVINTRVAVAKLEQSIKWEGIYDEDEDVDVVILFAVRDVDANTNHVLLLQQVAIFLADDDFIKELHQVENVEELYQLLVKKGE